MNLEEKGRPLLEGKKKSLLLANLSGMICEMEADENELLKYGYVKSEWE